MEQIQRQPPIGTFHSSAFQFLIRLKAPAEKHPATGSCPFALHRLEISGDQPKYAQGRSVIHVDKWIPAGFETRRLLSGSKSAPKPELSAPGHYDGIADVFVRLEM